MVRENKRSRGPEYKGQAETETKVSKRKGKKNRAKSGN
jgi:hypothetical protein